MSSSTTVDLQLVTEQAQNISDEHQRVLAILHKTINTHIQYTIQDFTQKVTTHTKDNKQQVKQITEELSKALKNKFSTSLLAIFSSLHDNLRDNDLSTFNFETWITNNVNALEENFGAQCIPSYKVLNIINDLSSTWTEKIEKLQTSGGVKGSQMGSPFSEISRPGEEGNLNKRTSPGKDYDEISETKSNRSTTGRTETKTENRSKSTGPGDGGALEGKSTFISRLSGLFKTNSSTEGTATKVNLGNEKNFKYDPIKKKYIFEGEEDVPEEEDNGPPPMAKATSVDTGKEKKDNEEADKEKDKGDAEPKKAPANNLLVPLSHRALSRKKEKGKGGATGATEPKKPAFMPSMFVPAAKVQEETKTEEAEKKVDEVDNDFGRSRTEEEVMKKIEEIFEKHELFQKNVLDYNKFKTVLENVENIIRKEMKEKLEKEMELLLLQKELETSTESTIKEISQKKTLELEISLLRDRVEQLSSHEQDLSIKLEDMEKELEMYREACSSKSEILSLVNESDYQEKITEAHFKSLQDANDQKKKVLEARNELRELEMQICEKELEAKIWEERYKEILRQNEEERKLPSKLRGLIEEYMKTQNEQDEVIIKLKEENCEVLKQYRKAFEELGRIAEENFKVSEEVRMRKEEIASLQRRIKDKESDLKRRDQRIKEIEEESQQRSEKINELEKSLKEKIKEKREFESQKENEIEEHLRIIDELKGNIDEMVRARERIQREKDEIIREKELLHKEKEEIIEEKELLRSEKTKLEHEKYELEKRVEELTYIQRKLETEKEKISNEKTHLLIEQENLSKEIETLERFKGELTRKNLGLEGKIQEMERETKGLKSERQQWSQSLLEFVKGLEQGNDNESTTEGQNVPKENNSFRIIREYMEETIRTCKEEEIVLRMMGVLEKVRESVESQVNGVKGRKELEKQDLQARIEGLEKGKGLVEDERNIMREEIERLGTLVREERARADGLKNQVEENARLEREEFNSRWLEMEQQMKDEKEKNEENLRRLFELQTNEEQFLRELEASAQDIEKFSQNLQTKENDLKELRENLEGQIEKLKEENQDLQQQLEEGFSQYDFLQGRAKETLDKIDNLNEENQILTQELETARQELNNKADLEAQNNTLKEEVESLRQRSNILSEELQLKDNEILDLKAQIESKGGVVRVDSSQLANKELEFSKLERKFREEAEEINRKNNLLEDSVTLLEEKVKGLEEDKRILRGQIITTIDESTKSGGRESDNLCEGVDGDKICASVERVYGDSPIYEYLKDFIEQMMIEKDVTPFKACLEVIGCLEVVLEKAKKERDDIERKIEAFAKALENGEIPFNQENFQQAKTEDKQAEISAIVEQLKNELEVHKRNFEDQKKELEDQKTENQELTKEVSRLKEEIGMEEPQQDSAQKKGEPTVKDLKKEVKKEQDKCKKLNVEVESFKKIIKNIDEERGAIQRSYAQIIKNLSQEIDELKRKKGIPIAPMTAKAVQTEEEAVPKQVEQASPLEKKQGFLAGLAKFI